MSLAAPGSGRRLLSRRASLAPLLVWRAVWGFAAKADSNTFIYTQPGSGKVKIKEPKQQLKIAADKMIAFKNQ